MVKETKRRVSQTYKNLERWRKYKIKARKRKT